MIAVTVGFVIGKATSTRQSPIYKAVLDLDTGMCLPKKMFHELLPMFWRYCVHVTFDVMWCDSQAQFVAVLFIT